MSHACHRFWTCYKTLTFCSLLRRCTIPCACHAKRHLNSEPPKVVRTPSVFNILTSKCASRHNGVHFFDISTSKSGANIWRFGHFDFEMCFAPQGRALFRHLNFQKWSGPGVFLYILTSKCASRHNSALFRHCNFSKCSEAEVFCTFWLRNVLRAATACNFSSLIWPDGSSRTRRFSEPTFRPSGATNQRKNAVFRDFPTFSRICIFFLLTLSLL